MTWRALELSAPELAAFGFERLNGKVAYLATTKANGAPRVHPVTPDIGEGRLFIFMEPTSPKGKDIQRNGQYSLHCGVSDNSGASGEFQVWGMGRLLTDPADRAIAAAASSYPPADRYILFELNVAGAFANEYINGRPTIRRWGD